MSETSAPLWLAKQRSPQVIEYAEQTDVVNGAIDRWGQRMAGHFHALRLRANARGLRAILRQVAQYDASLRAMSDAELKARVVTLRRDLRLASANGPLSAKAAGPAFALVREVAARTLGQRHYDVQVLGAWAMMRGMVAEMRTGEGKTLCATLAAATAALAGEPVHVITVNDYLAKRDAGEMAPLYEFLGLSVGVVLSGQKPPERRAIYAADIVYGSNKEIAFDYLRDRMVLRTRPGNLNRKIDRLTARGEKGELVMRGLHFAIVDEGDSVLIDEARTPLIISGSVTVSDGDLALFTTAMQVAGTLTEGQHYRVIRDESRIDLLDAGLDLLEDLAEDQPDPEATGGFQVAVIREHAVTQALTALHLFHLDIDYIINDGEVQIVDEFTGRVMADRSWSEGLHQMIELKEGLALTPPRETLSRITYQRYFRRYLRMGAMTGTASDAAVELWSVYRLAVAKIPTNKTDIRSASPDRVFRTEAEKWAAIGQRIAGLHEQGAAVLLGTRSVAASEAASAVLQGLGIPHRVLNARQDADEAAIVAAAGRPATVTVATNMAGRGTDIKLAPGVAQAGGLHVILSERHDSRRIDRQLAGRCGRQGDPGHVEAFLSLEDELMRPKDARLARSLARGLARFGLAGLGFRLRQRHIERIHARMRHDLLEADRSLSDLLAFSGRME